MVEVLPQLRDPCGAARRILPLVGELDREPLTVLVRREQGKP